MHKLWVFIFVSIKLLVFKSKIFTAPQRSYGKELFSFVSVCSGRGVPMWPLDLGPPASCPWLETFTWGHPRVGADTRWLLKRIRRYASYWNTFLSHVSLVSATACRNVPCCWKININSNCHSRSRIWHKQTVASKQFTTFIGLGSSTF